MELINIISQESGNAPTIEHVAVNQKEDTTNAEELFMTKAKALGWDAETHYCETEDQLLEEAYFENNNGDSVSLVWTNLNQ
jgi:hypothetical protein